VLDVVTMLVDTTVQEAEREEIPAGAKR